MKTFKRFISSDLFWSIIVSLLALANLYYCVMLFRKYGWNYDLFLRTIQSIGVPLTIIISVVSFHISRKDDKEKFEYEKKEKNNEWLKECVKQLDKYIVLSDNLLQGMTPPSDYKEKYKNGIADDEAEKFKRNIYESFQKLYKNFDKEAQREFAPLLYCTADIYFSDKNEIHKMLVKYFSMLMKKSQELVYRRDEALEQQKKFDNELHEIK